MKKFPSFLISIVLVVGTLAYLGLRAPKTLGTVQAQAMVQQEIYPTATLIPYNTPTASVVPSPTIGYQATADAAMSTAGAAVQVANSVISTLNVVNIEQARITDDDAARKHDEYMADVALQGGILTQQLTSVPLTSTAQVRSDEIEIGAQNVELARITSTWAAPMLITAAERAEREAIYGGALDLASIVALIGVGLGGLALVVFVVRQKPAVRASEQSTAEKEQGMSSTVDVTLRRNNGRVVDNRTWPGTLKELLIMADEINRDPSLGINRWDKVKGPTGGMLFGRARRKQVMFFLTSNLLAVEATNNEVVLLEEGINFFEDVLNLHDAPLPYKIDPHLCPESGEINHDHENHDHESGGGGVAIGLNASGGPA